MADVEISDSASIDAVSSLVDGLSRLKTEKPGKPLGICFEVLGGDDDPPATPVDGSTEP